MSEIVRYRGWIANTQRWLTFPRRAGDIVICAPVKSGTRWMQMLVLLLVFDGVPEQPISDISPWLDMHLRSTDEVFALLAAQRHRRVIKTHAPLDGLPWDDQVTYIDVGRDPRDAFASMQGRRTCRLRPSSACVSRRTVLMTSGSTGQTPTIRGRSCRRSSSSSGTPITVTSNSQTCCTTTSSRGMPVTATTSTSPTTPT